ncbi:MAG: phosphoglycerate mutase family protein, partial [Planctomycetota bacterium]|nr:phosphoglycerate mutase family protein [Planctomycetota bacterium]
MTARLLLVRHGNTFRDNEIPRRVGRRTDLRLVEEARSEKAARFLLDAGLRPDRVFAAPLRRTMETAGIIVRTMGLPLTPIPADAFSEIDYGPDENRTEEEVMLRLGRARLSHETNEKKTDETYLLEEGRKVLDAWDKNAVVP